MTAVVTMEERQGCLTVQLRGEFDLSALPSLAPLLEIPFEDYLAVVLDLGETEFMDCAVLGALLTMLQLGDVAATPLVFWRPRPVVLLLLTTLGLHRKVALATSPDLDLAVIVALSSQKVP